MNVRDLIKLLQKQDQDAEVLLMEQQSWPFEYAILGVTTRSDCVQHERSTRGDDDALTIHDECELEYAKDGKRPSDVFLVEGATVRYGAKAAWSTAREEP